MIFIYIVVIAAILLIIYSAKEPEKKEQPKPFVSNLTLLERKNETTISESAQPKRIVPIPQVKTSATEVDYSVFEDHYDDFNEYDYSYLTPSEAKKELAERKENEEWIESKEYWAYMDAIHADKYERWLEKLEDKTPTEALKWFNQNIGNDVKMNTAIWKAVGEKVSPLHEDELLQKLEKVTGGRVEGWVRARKKEGYFFTQTVYDKALEIRESYLANKK